MNRLIWSLSIGFFALSVGACALETDPTSVAEAAPTVTTVADVRNEPLPQAIAPASASSPEDALVMPIAYACTGGRSFVAAFPADGSVRISAAGETRRLAHRDAADAMMFSDGEVTLTADGAEATLSGLDGLYSGCIAG